ncbi:uroporphyrinogen-III C-methyltransferase [Thermodesulfovibrio sp.]|uniref:uroporphyrinogen-III C-methyltransferase n=1 Tax=Thermodesulfovibrio sp. TaxID=2067987 RepID=UPI0030ABFAB8
MKKGTVYLVGAGPGDAGLITLKGLRAIQQADCIVYDFHINPRLLTYAKYGAEFVYAGKRGGHHEMSQDEINQVLVQKAKEGKIVCRLKGGDPFVFGRGGEEVEILSKEGITFEIIPGVSSVIAVPAYAGIPITHRKVSSAFTVITGNEDLSKQERIFTHIRASNSAETMIFLMCVKNLETITNKLIQEGLKEHTPAAIIRWGTRPEQKVITGTISDISKLAKENQVSPPAILVIGEVVKLREKLGWFEKKPLYGQRVLITRQLTEDYLLLEDMGAELFVFPTIAFFPPEDFSELDTAIDKIENYQFLVFPSPRAVSFFFDRFLILGKDIRNLKGIKICAIGKETSKSLKQYGINADIVPDEYNSEAMINRFKEELSKFSLKEGLHVLYPRSNISLKNFIDEMKSAGINVDAPITYRTVKPTEHGKRLARFLREGRITIATFTSPSSFLNLLDILRDDAREMLRDVTIAALGKTTAKAIEEAGYTVNIIPKKSTIKDMVEAIVEWVVQR